MSRPTTGAVTGAGFSQSGSGTLYTKTTGTAVAHVDVGSGEVSIQPAVAGTQMAAADVTAHLVTLAALGVYSGAIGGHDVPIAAPGVQYIGYSIS